MHPMSIKQRTSHAGAGDTAPEFAIPKQSSGHVAVQSSADASDGGHSRRSEVEDRRRSWRRSSVCSRCCRRSCFFRKTSVCNLTNGIHDFAVQAETTDHNNPVKGARCRTEEHSKSQTWHTLTKRKRGKGGLPAAKYPSDDAHGITHACHGAELRRVKTKPMRCNEIKNTEERLRRKQGARRHLKRG
jgi:hypothetical protein